MSTALELSPAHSHPKTRNAAPIKTSRSAASETSDLYARVVISMDKWRVIEGACGLQWILQFRQPSQWRQMAYCGTKEGLQLAMRRHGLCPDAADHLPDFFPKPSTTITTDQGEAA